MAVLLTGATGFLGSRLCAALLRRTGREVVCVVRASTAGDVEERVRSRLRVQDPDVAGSARLRCVPGELTEEGLGLAPGDHEELCRSVDEVYHCGASVNMGAPYEQVAPVNVGATARVVEFCRTGRRKRLHHVSTLGVFLTAREEGRPEVDESDVATPETAGPLGYPRSKAEAESLVTAAMRDGLEATLYRPGLILADTRSGACPADDFTARVLAATVLTGSFPRCHGHLPVVPVDHAAETIAALSLLPAPHPRAYHVMLPAPLRASLLFDWARDFGYRLRETPAEEWWRELKARGTSRAALAMRTLSIARYGLGLSPHTVMPSFGCEASVRAALGAGVPYGPLDADYAPLMFRHLIGQRVLPPLDGEPR